MKKQVKSLSILNIGFVFAAAFYAFGLPMLGLIDFGMPHMFAHLKLRGGSNHLFLPTGLVQHWLALESPLTHWAASFAGGEVRVEYTDSRFFNGNFPGEYTFLTPEPLVRKKLRANGHIGRFFAMGVSHRTQLPITREEYAAVVSDMSKMLPWEVGKLMNGNKQQHGALYNTTALDGAEFVKYTLSANELRFLLEGARKLGESFMLQYTQIRENKGVPPGDGGQLDETWRAKGCGRAVTLREADGKLTCHIQDTCAGNASTVMRCASDDIPLLPTPGFWSRKFVLSNPYPILDPPGRHCGGSG